MEIISLSLDSDTMDKIGEIQDNGSFNGRSELFRKAIENLHQQVSDRNQLEGRLNAVIVVRHPHRKEQEISEISHQHDEVILTQLHSKLENDRCLEVFHTEGPASSVIGFYNALEGSKHTEAVNILPQSK